MFGASSESETQPEVRIPASDGDLLMMMNEQVEGLYYRYSIKDGSHLVVSYDTLKPNFAFINGKLGQIRITDESELEKLGDELLVTQAYNPVSLIIEDTLTDAMIQRLEDLRPDLNGIGIFLDTEITGKQFVDLLTVCMPEWMATENFPSDPQAGQVKIPENLEFLWVSGNGLALLARDQCCNDLETLVISDWEAGQGETLPLSGLKHCHTLSLIDCNLTDLSAIEFPEGLMRLHFIGCDTLTDISRIAELPHLISLGLAGSDDITSLEPVSGLAGLKRIAFPENALQEEFNSLVAQLPSLEIVELIECQGISDLSPLIGSNNLRVLVLHPADPWPENLGSLKQLKMVIISSEVFEHTPERIDELRNQLPDALIVPGNGLCMGSGWLLMLLPMILIARFFFRRR
jgi:hypothetical protein